jgi:hypothetical protein
MSWAIRIPIVVFLCFGAISVSSDAYAQGADSTEKKLNLLADFAEKICGDIPLYSDEKTGTASVKADAEFDKLLKKLANIGVRASASGSIATFHGVMQKDKFAAIHDNLECRQKMVDDLLTDVFPPQAAPTPPPTHHRPPVLYKGPFPSSEDEQNFRAALTADTAPKAFAIYCVADSPNSYRYAEEILEAIRKAAWPTDGLIHDSTGKSFQPPDGGVEIAAKSESLPGIKVLQDALSKIKIDATFSKQTWIGDDKIELYVGKRQ